MNAGTINYSTANYGGAVFVAKDGKFTLDGGTIGNNTAGYGGGVFIARGGELIMEDGTITNNRAIIFEEGYYDDYGGGNNEWAPATVGGGDGGGVYAAGGDIYYPHECTCTFICISGCAHCEDLGCYAGHSMGACKCDGDGCSETVECILDPEDIVCRHCNGDGCVEPVECIPGPCTTPQCPGGERCIRIACEMVLICANKDCDGTGCYRTGEECNICKNNITGGVLVRQSGKFTMNGGTVSNNNAQRDGGGIFMEDFGTRSSRVLSITTNTNAAFSGNTAGIAPNLRPYWLGDAAYPVTAMYNPGVVITIGDLRGLHGTGTGDPIRRRSSNNGLSDSPAGRPGFTFLANNFDLNFNGDAVYSSPVLEAVPSSIFFGTGTIPTRYTLFGLESGFGQALDLRNHRVNPNADRAPDIEFKIRNPIGASWSLDLECTLFYRRDQGTPIAGSPGMRPVAVSRTGVVDPNAFYGGSALRMYSAAEFRADWNAVPSLVDYDATARMGTWTWDRFRHDITVEALSGMGIINDTYVSIFTWTLIDSP